MKQILTLSILLLSGSVAVNAQTKNDSTHKLFTASFQQDSCTFLTTGRNQFFILEPGYQLILEGLDGKDSSRLVITVLHETKLIGNLETRIVEENETVNGKTVEISRNYFAFCKQTGSVYYFGEDVDMYKHNQIVSHEGSWKAVGNNKAGIAMPGNIPNLIK